MPLPPNANDPDRIAAMRADKEFRALCDRLNREADRYGYSYNFTWLGQPVIQNPEDLVVLQEIIWSQRPDVVIETGIAHGGSLLFYSSILELLGGDGIVVGVDIEIRPNNRRAIEEHPLAHRIVLIEGSSTDPQTLRAVGDHAAGRNRAMVILDSDHSHDHVLNELRAYSPFVSSDGYLIVLDTGIEDMDGDFPDRPWGKGNNPKTAVEEFLRSTDRFVVASEIEAKLLITCAPGGFLRCVRS